MDSSDKKKYNKMEEVLKRINAKFVTINDDDKKKTNPVLKFVIENIIRNMKDESPLFKNMYETVFYGGSYFDGLKVGKPEEFDIDLKMVLPKLAEPKLELSSEPGFMRCQLTGWDKLVKNKPEYEKYINLANYMDDKKYLKQNEILRWMESIVTRALQKYPRNGQNYIMNYPSGGPIEITMRKGGPAMTLLIKYPTLNITMDVDLVASFKFTENMWPPSPFRPCPSQLTKREFLIVPKTKNNTNEVKERLWRLSFQEQERELMNGNEKFKPALRLMKKLRDTQNQGKISSYFLKTIFLHEVMNNPDRDFWNSPLSYVLMKMLYAYYNCLERKEILYFWNKKNNLIKIIDERTLDNYKCRIKIIIDDIEKKFENNPNIIAEYILPVDERTSLIEPTLLFMPREIILDKKLSTPPEVEKNDIFQFKSTENENFCDKILKTLNENHKIVIAKITDLQNSVDALRTDNLRIKNDIFALKEIKNHIENIDEPDSSTSNKNQTPRDQIEGPRDKLVSRNWKDLFEGSRGDSESFEDNLGSGDLELDSRDFFDGPSVKLVSGDDFGGPRSLDLENNNLRDRVTLLEKMICDLKYDNENFKQKLLEYVKA